MITSVQERARKLWATAAKPEEVTGWLQIAKAVIAATIAWWVTRDLLASQLPFLAPWTALLTVHVTVYRSVSAASRPWSPRSSGSRCPSRSAPCSG